MINRILSKSIIGLVLFNFCIYSQDCSDGFTYFENIPGNVTNINNDSNCFSDEDINVLDNIISINELNYDSPLDIGTQTWATSRLETWVATYIPSGGNGITQKIDQLPDNIGQLSELTNLYIEKHDITELPESFTSLSSLVSLYVSNNWLVTLPSDFGSLTNLITLDLGYNQLESIPESIGNLINLEYLFLFNNQLISLPETICNLTLDWDGISPANYPYFASGGNYLCFAELIPDCVENSNNFNTSMEQNYYSFLLDAPQDCPVFVDYLSEIQPIFNARCTNCHGSSGGLNLTSYTTLMAGGNSGDVVIPYDHASSELWTRVFSGQMPQGDDDCTGDEINLIAQWIDEGALEDFVSGCTDPAAYNCSNDDDWSNYIFDIGGIMYDNSCNWDWNTDTEESDYVGGCESGPCEGYYDSDADGDDGSCRYYQAPHGEEVVFTLEDNGISVDWSVFTPPVNSVLESYRIQRCVGTGCTWLAGYGPGDSHNTATSVIDVYDYEQDVEIKYAIAVEYSNNPYWGWAIGASYVTPPNSCSCPICIAGDLDGNAAWNILDVVQLANCVLADNCQTIENSCAADVNGDGNYNVLDIVSLANCVLTATCGGD